MNESLPKQEPPYGLRMPPDLKARVKAAAEASSRSMNAEIVATLAEKYPPPREPTLGGIREILGVLGTLEPQAEAEKDAAYQGFVADFVGIFIERFPNSSSAALRELGYELSAGAVKQRS